MSEAIAGTAASAKYQHCVNVYHALAEDAVEMELPRIPGEEAVTGLVYTGFVTKLFAARGLSIPYYTPIMNALKDMDCIRQLRRGGGPSPSQWLLMQPPTTELFDGMEVKEKGPDAPEEQRWRDLNKRVGDLETQVEALLEEVFAKELKEVTG